MLKPQPLSPASTNRRQYRAAAGGRLDAMAPETKLRLQRLLRQNAGVLRQDATSILLGVYSIAPGQMSNKELDKRFSAVAMEMLREQEDRDLHPFGRGGRFEGVLYSRRVKVQVDHTKFLAWIVNGTPSKIATIIANGNNWFHYRWPTAQQQFYQLIRSAV
uniref:Serine hydrolase n=1 Tax=Macrostomum lignano TaxID=282301 RepID=A0A1I8HJ73_9PLAT